MPLASSHRLLTIRSVPWTVPGVLAAAALPSMMLFPLLSQVKSDVSSNAWIKCHLLCKASYCVPCTSKVSLLTDDCPITLPKACYTALIMCYYNTYLPLFSRVFSFVYSINAYRRNKFGQGLLRKLFRWEPGEFPAPP